MLICHTITIVVAEAGRASNIGLFLAILILLWLIFGD